MSEKTEGAIKKNGQSRETGNKTQDVDKNTTENEKVEQHGLHQKTGGEPRCF